MSVTFATIASLPRSFWIDNYDATTMGARKRGALIVYAPGNQLSPGAAAMIYL